MSPVRTCEWTCCCSALTRDVMLVIRGIVRAVVRAGAVVWVLVILLRTGWLVLRLTVSTIGASKVVIACMSFLLEKGSRLLSELLLWAMTTMLMLGRVLSLSSV